MPYNRAAAMKCLHALGAKAGYSHEELRELAASQFSIKGKVSISKLTDNQLSTLIETLKGTKPGQPMMVPNALTQPQRWRINQLMKEKLEDNPARLAGFMQRVVKKDRIAQLTKFEASKVIDGLKNLSERCNTRSK